MQQIVQVKASGKNGLGVPANSSQPTRCELNIFHDVKCKSNWITYLLECNLCKNHYVGKSERTFNIHSNNRKKDFENLNLIETDKYFQLSGPNFDANAKFVLVEQLINRMNLPTETLKGRSKNRDNIWIKKLKTVIPN